MSSLPRKPFFLHQLGIALWEDQFVLSDPMSETVTVCAPSLSDLVNAFRVTVSTRPDDLPFVFRCDLVLLQDWYTESQRRRFLASLQKSPPGFTETIERVQERRVTVISRMEDETAVQLESLSYYPGTALLETDREIDFQFLAHNNLLLTIADFQTAGISEIRRAVPSWVILRVIQSETNSVFQLIASSAACRRASVAIAKLGFGQIEDRGKTPALIQDWWS